MGQLIGYGLRCIGGAVDDPQYVLRLENHRFLVDGIRLDADDIDKLRKLFDSIFPPETK